MKKIWSAFIGAIIILCIGIGLSIGIFIFFICLIIDHLCEHDSNYNYARTLRLTLGRLLFSFKQMKCEKAFREE